MHRFGWRIRCLNFQLFVLKVVGNITNSGNVGHPSGEGRTYFTKQYVGLIGKIMVSWTVNVSGSFSQLIDFLRNIF
jgi:hypothetical protein